MIYNNRPVFCCVVAVAHIFSIGGCGSGRGSGTDLPDVSASAAAKQAIELFDQDGSGALDESELVASPGILSARAAHDADGDGQISRDEIENCITKIYAAGTPWASVHCRVVQGGTPISGADVRFVPESFLADALPPATGKTDNQGRVSPAVANDQLPEDKKGLRVMRLGIYRVEVRHPSIKQPHKPLGCVVDDNIVRSSTELILQP